MEPATITTLNRSEQIDFVSEQLPSAAGLLARLLLRQLGGELSRTELGLLNTLSSGPGRITELAEMEGLAQPTMTSLVKQLEQQGLVRRERQADDGRVVLVQLTDDGAVVLEDYRTRVRELLGSYLAEIPDEQVEALAAATDAMARLVALLQQQHNRGARSPRTSQRGTLP
jgi:DNA-binding MarR family transcriptional regulator